MSVTPSQFDVLARSINAAAQRHRVLSNNLANVNTPGYQRLEIEFGDLLRAAGAGEQRAEGKIVVDPSAVPRGDGNSVDIDVELNEVQKNSLAAGAYVQILASKLSMMRTAITGR